MESEDKLADALRVALYWDFGPADLDGELLSKYHANMAYARSVLKDHESHAQPENFGVLAVMDAAAKSDRARAASISGCSWIHQKYADEMAEARAAVAALIDACAAAVTEEGMSQDELNRLRDALASVAGDASQPAKDR